MRTLRIAEFFAGGGMVRAALPVVAPAEVVFANDFSPLKAAQYHRAWGEALTCGDVALLDAASLPAADVWWASSPCQDLSLAGRGAGLGSAHGQTRSGAFWGWTGLLAAVPLDRRPPLLVLENVLGLLRPGALEVVTAQLETLGYHGLIGEVDAACWLPHSRPRVLILAARLDLGWPLTQGVASPALALALRRCSPLWGALSQPRTGSVPALADLLESGLRWEPGLPAPVTGESARRVAALRPGDAPLPGYRRTRAGQVVLEVRADGRAGCLRPAGGGSSVQFLVRAVAGGLEHRRFTPREGARLMGLPDSYVLSPVPTQAWQVVGDGVAVPVAAFVLGLARALLDQGEAALSGTQAAD